MGSYCCHQPPNQKEIEHPVSIIYDNISEKKVVEPQINQFIEQEQTSNINEDIVPVIEIHQQEIMFPDGSRYFGFVKNGVPHGQGTESHENGDKYVGPFIQGVKQGKGIYSYANGIVYEGDFIKGEFNGLGRMRWPNGDQYQGQFLNSLIHGYGKYLCKRTNSYYEGSYFNGKKHGKGKIISNNNILQGNWQNGQFVFRKQVKFSQ